MSDRDRILQVIRENPGIRASQVYPRLTGSEHGCPLCSREHRHLRDAMASLIDDHTVKVDLDWGLSLRTKP